MAPTVLRNYWFCCFESDSTVWEFIQESVVFPDRACLFASLALVSKKICLRGWVLPVRIHHDISECYGGGIEVKLGFANLLSPGRCCSIVVHFARVLSVQDLHVPFFMLFSKRVFFISLQSAATQSSHLPGCRGGVSLGNAR